MSTRDDQVASDSNSRRLAVTSLARSGPIGSRTTVCSAELQRGVTEQVASDRHLNSTGVAGLTGANHFTASATGDGDLASRLRVRAVSNRDVATDTRFRRLSSTEVGVTTGAARDVEGTSVVGRTDVGLGDIGTATSLAGSKSVRRDRRARSTTVARGHPISGTRVHHDSRDLVLEGRAIGVGDVTGSTTRRRSIAALDGVSARTTREAGVARDGGRTGNRQGKSTASTTVTDGSAVTAVVTANGQIAACGSPSLVCADGQIAANSDAGRTAGTARAAIGDIGTLATSGTGHLQITNHDSVLGNLKGNNRTRATLAGALRIATLTGGDSEIALLGVETNGERAIALGDGRTGTTRARPARVGTVSAFDSQRGVKRGSLLELGGDNTTISTISGSSRGNHATRNTVNSEGTDFRVVEDRQGDVPHVTAVARGGSLTSRLAGRIDHERRFSSAGCVSSLRKAAVDHERHAAGITAVGSSAVDRITGKKLKLLARRERHTVGEVHRHATADRAGGRATDKATARRQRDVGSPLGVSVTANKGAAPAGVTARASGSPSTTLNRELLAVGNRVVLDGHVRAVLGHFVLLSVRGVTQCRVNRGSSAVRTRHHSVLSSSPGITCRERRDGQGECERRNDNSASPDRNLHIFNPLS
ncbi:hypothetical protein IHV25_01045 [Phaeovibrio sulfidiphilus]|uniref:Uncharacterized protein n=1 Tax=Phaeovibrio sulfidiphilus TaxID=1220600 RepID=A0A8J7CBK0_9PROT|nr:hypothetical protein [Phaeovibrio sulfidiphilus]MBE1236243.1 hypothetical protein [Phaeovibrio sulfidiphilus]